jgi:hypothetical protein
VIPLPILIPRVQRRVAAALIKDVRAVSLSHPVPIFFGVVMVMISSVPSAYPVKRTRGKKDKVIKREIK